MQTAIIYTRVSTDEQAEKGYSLRDQQQRLEKHCEAKGCKERYKNDVAHNAFKIWLGDISIKPEIGSLYLAVMEDVFKTNQGDRNAEIKKLQSEIDKNMEVMDKSAKKFVNDDLDKFDYKRIKENLSKENTELKAKITELKSTETGFQEYYRYGFSLLSNLKQYYSSANLENKQKMLGLIFPEKLVFSDQTFQTVTPNEVLTLLCNEGKVSAITKKTRVPKIRNSILLVTHIGQFSNHLFERFRKIYKLKAFIRVSILERQY